MCPYYLSLFSLFLKNSVEAPCYVLAMFNIYIITRITSNSASSCILNNKLYTVYPVPRIINFNCALPLYVNNVNKLLTKRVKFRAIKQTCIRLKYMFEKSISSENFLFKVIILSAAA